jgi:ribosomal protein L40E
VSLEQLECPDCGSNTLVSNADGTMTCSFCGNHYAAPEGGVCPACGEVNDKEAGYCRQCGYDLIRECPRCGADNPHGATHCQNCGRSLSVLETVVERVQMRTADRLDRQMRDAGDIKAQEEAASQRRLEEMWEREYERQQAIAEAQIEQKRQEMLLMRLAFAGVALFILILIVAVLVLGCSGVERAPASLPILLVAYA